MLNKIFIKIRDLLAAFYDLLAEGDDFL